MTMNEGMESKRQEMLFGYQVSFLLFLVSLIFLTNYLYIYIYRYQDDDNERQVGWMVNGRQGERQGSTNNKRVV